jgi:hypothetical protein
VLLDELYRLFNHAVLALSCACLLQAEKQFLPALDLAIPPVVFVIFVAFLAERRWTLPDVAANLLGVLIAVATVWWMFDQVRSPTGPIVLPLPTGLVPHLGPVLIALLLVKLFRPRRPADFWVLQGLGLLQVALACVLAVEPRFGSLIAGYLACGVACLALRHVRELGLRDTDGRVSSVANDPAAIRVPAGPFLRRPLLWVPFVGLLGAALFLATPRGHWQSWDPLKSFGFHSGSIRPVTGFTEEINLNRTGELELDDEIAFTVTALDAADQPIKLPADPADQHWRGTVLENYREGYWSASERTRITGPNRRLLKQDSLPHLGQSQYFLAFKVQPRRAGGLFLAEPIRLGTGDTRLPVVLADTSQPIPFFEFSGTILPSHRITRPEYEYRQVATPVGVPYLVNAENLIFREYAHLLLAQPPDEIVTWTKDVLRDLAAKNLYDLTPADLDLDQTQRNDTGEPIPRSAERVSRALCDYLAKSGVFSYTLDQRRNDPDADPAVDFLCNVRAGHCERFASGLALMLRGCGIPARVVKGFRGAEPQGEGVYVVRQRDAHTWVEALVPRSPSPDQAAQIVGLASTADPNLLLAASLSCRSERVGCDWLVLDPTPATEALQPPFSLWRWCQMQWRRTDVLWRELVLDFSGDQQADLWIGLTASRPGRELRRLLVLIVGTVTLTWFAVWIARRVPGWYRAWRARARHRMDRPAPVLLARLFKLLARHLGVRPESGTTPRETAAAAAAVMRRRAATAPLAGLPGRVVELYYRFRFGGLPLDDAERRSVDDELGRLEAALRAAPIRP